MRREALLIDPKLDIEIMGSYRRGAENSGDVDFLITRNDADGLNHSGVMEKLVRKLMFMGIITHEVSHLGCVGNELISQLSAPHDWKALEAKWMGVGRLSHNSLHRRIGEPHPISKELTSDILCIPFEQWGAALLYFTGNDIVRHPHFLPSCKWLISVQPVPPFIRSEEGIQPKPEGFV